MGEDPAMRRPARELRALGGGEAGAARRAAVFHSCEGTGSGQSAPEPPPPLLAGPRRRSGRSGRAVVAWSAVGAAVVVLSVGAVLLLVGAVPGFSAAGNEVAPPFCRGRSCAGLDPDVALCSYDAVTAASAQLAGREVELRVSHRCRAAWALLPVPRAGDTAEVQGVNGRRQRQDAPDTGVRAFTAMVPVPVGGGRGAAAVRACIVAVDGRVCTAGAR